MVLDRIIEFALVKIDKNHIESQFIIQYLSTLLNFLV